MLKWVKSLFVRPAKTASAGLSVDDFSVLVTKHFALCFGDVEPPDDDDYWALVDAMNAEQSAFLGGLQLLIESAKQMPMGIDEIESFNFTYDNLLDFRLVDESAREFLDNYVTLVRREWVGNDAPTVTSVSNHSDGGDEQAHQFLRDATMHHDNKNFDAAIESLRSAYALLNPLFSNYPMSVWVRLPLYLQKAGRFNESMHGFGLLIEKISERERPSYLSEVQHRAQTATDLAFVFDKVRLTAQREKQFDMMAYYGLNAQALDLMSHVIRGSLGTIQLSEGDEDSENMWLELLEKYGKSKSLQKNKDKVLTACYAFDQHQDCNRLQADTLFLLT